MSWDQKIAAYDEAALTELASVGLVRRARKQLAAGRLNVERVAAEDDMGTLSVAGHTVTIPDAPLDRAACSCPAAGICVHILAAVLASRRPSDEASIGGPEETAAAAADPVAELERLGPSAVLRWAGKPGTRLAAQLLSTMPEGDRRVTVAETTVEVVLSEAVRCRYVSGAGLDGAICEAPDRRRKGVVAACLLYWLQTRGAEILWPDDTGVDQPAAALDAGERDLVGRVREALAQMLDAGLMHLPPHTAALMRDLAWSVRGERLPRLSAMLLLLAGELEALHQGAPGATSDGLLDRVTAIWMLSEALERCPEGNALPLRGRFRRDYQPQTVGPMWLVGAYQYATGSGAKGISLVFWDLDRNAPLTVNSGRSGEAARNFTPASAWREALGWQRGRSPEALNGKVVRLKNARVSDDGRLSLSGATRLAGVTAAVDEPEIDGAGFVRWEQVVDRLKQELLQPDPRPGPVVVRPAAVGSLQLAERQQQWAAAVRDADGKRLWLTMPVDDNRNRRARAFNRLVAKAAAGIWGVVLVPRLDPRGVGLEPVSLIMRSTREVVCLHPDLAFIDFKRHFKLGSFLKHLIARPAETTEECNASPEGLIALDRLLAQLQDLLLGAGEMGLTCGYVTPAKADGPLQGLRSAGADLLDRCCRRFVRQPTAENLVRARYALKLADRHLHVHGLIR